MLIIKQLPDGESGMICLGQVFSCTLHDTPLHVWLVGGAKVLCPLVACCNAAHSRGEPTQHVRARA
jgi:hypothetical protein